MNVVGRNVWWSLGLAEAPLPSRSTAAKQLASIVFVCVCECGHVVFIGTVRLHESWVYKLPSKEVLQLYKGGLDLLYFGSLAASPKSSWIWRLLFVSRLGFRGNCVAFCVNLAPVWTTEIPFKGQTITGLWHFASALGRRKSQFDLRNLLPWETLDWSHSWGSGDLSS